jgi:hypothetical protein
VVRYERYKRKRKRSVFFLVTPKNEENIVSGLFIVLTGWQLCHYEIFRECNLRNV